MRGRNEFDENTVTSFGSLLPSRSLCPYGEERCVTTQKTAVEKTSLS